MKEFKYFTIAAILILLTQSSHGQTSFEPQNLGPSVNSKYSEFNPVLSIDGKTLFFNRANHPDNRMGDENTQDIWYSTLQEDGTWSKAQRLPSSVNIGRYNAFLSALDDGKSYLIFGKFNKKGTRWLSNGFSIITKLNDYEWSKPVPLKVPKFSKKSIGRGATAFMTPDRTLLFTSFANKENSRRLSIYVSKKKKENKYSRPKRITIEPPKDGSRARSLESPFLTSDKNRLYFTADIGLDNDNYDIYYAARTDDSYLYWAVPTKVTDTVNTPYWDSYFKLNTKGSWAYFSSVSKSIGRSDIYRVKIFEEFPFVRLTGLILNQADQTLMLEEKSYEILINGEAYSGLKIDRYSASYEVLLPLGGLYTLQPQMENWNGVSSDVDLTKVREYTEAKLNLYFSAIPFVQVKGRVINSRTNSPISLSLNPRVLINGELSDSVIYDQFSGAFQALLPLGQVYTFSGLVDNYIASSVIVDVSEATAFVEKEVNLLVTSVPWVEIKGQLLDNSSLTPIATDAQPRIIINGEAVDTVYIDPINSNFTLKLPFGRIYTLGVEAKNYKTIDNQINLASYFEYALINQNLFAEREDANAVSLTGKIINTKTGKQLDEGYEVKMRVNGVESPAFSYDSKTANYTLKLPVGFNYDLTPRVMNFYNRFEPVDLTAAAPMSSVTRNFYVTPIEIGQSVDIENIYFETGRAALKPESFRSLNALIEFLKEYPNVRVEIGGHTDNVGSSEINKRISQERALEVAEYIIQQGMPANRIESKGYGFDKPKASNRTAEGRAQNRRVDFTIIGI